MPNRSHTPDQNNATTSLSPPLLRLNYSSVLTQFPCLQEKSEDTGGASQCTSSNPASGGSTTAGLGSGSRPRGRSTGAAGASSGRGGRDDRGRVGANRQSVGLVVERESGESSSKSRERSWQWLGGDHGGLRGHGSRLAGDHSIDSRLASDNSIAISLGEKLGIGIACGRTC
jgi:hypothetical protein